MISDVATEAEQSAQRELELYSFGQRFTPGQLGNAATAQLHALLTSAQAQRSLSERVEWVEQLGRWVLDGPALPRGPEITAREDERTLRLRLLVKVLEALPDLRADMAATVRAVLAETSGLQLFCATGMPAERGFLYEAADRLTRKLLPLPRDDKDISALLSRVFHREAHAEWLSAVDPALLAAFTACLADGNPADFTAFASMRESLQDALILVSQRVSVLGLSDDVRARSPDASIRGSPFLQLPRAFAAVVAELRAPGSPNLAAARADCEAALRACRRFVRAAFRHLDKRGVSVDLVYRLELVTKGFDRLWTMLVLLSSSEAPVPGGEPTPTFKEAVHFLSLVIQDGHRGNSVLELIRGNAHHLARKIIERTGISGEHYITASRAEYRQMLASASGGGFVMAFTAAIKYALLGLALPRFFEGLFTSLNYAGSFLLMQMVGFTLATKQPSMTAAALAAVLETGTDAVRRARQLNTLVELIARIVRSQLAAAVGNIGMVACTALAFHFAFRRITGHAVLDEETSRHVLHSLDPLHSSTLLLAALTGGCLWLSSVAGGWVENWAVYRRLPEALAEHRGLRRLLGPARAERFAQGFLSRVSGMGVSITLGFLLGMAPAIGHFFGVTLDSRHVTLSTGSLTYAVCSLGWSSARELGLGAAVVGVFCVLLLNFFVSFSLALTVALRARDIPMREQLHLVRATLSRFVHAPLQFLVPPKQTEPLPQPALSELDEGT